MIGSLFDYWRYTWPDVWSVLARSRKAPPDLFIELYRTASDFLRIEPDYKVFELATNDPEQARQAFEGIHAPDFGTEATIIDFMEAAFGIIRDFEVERYEELYRRLVRSFLRKYNLRYRVDYPFRLQLVLPGVFAGLYTYLGRLNQTDTHLAGLMADFERSFGNYARSKGSNDLQTCISKASIYAEGVAGKTLGKPEGTLGDLCKELHCWPHSAVRASLSSLYGFCSNYPGIRHAGDPKGKLRELEPRDAVLVCLLLVAFSGYLTDQVSMDDVLAL